MGDRPRQQDRPGGKAMPRRLYLHVGVHRTATTSIQSFLRANFGPLQSRGIFNPFASGRHVHLMNRLFSGETSVAEVAADLTTRADAKPSPIRTIVLSDEDIVMRRDLSPLAAFRDHFEVRVILALRRQDLWLESWHQQNVKWQWNPDLAHLTFPEFLDRRETFHWTHYDRLVRHLEELFGTNAVQLITFEPAEMPGGPVATFARAIGLETLDGLAAPGHVNVSLTPVMSEFMRTLPLDEFEGPQRQLIERACQRADAEIRKAGSRPSALLMTAETRAQILAEYAGGNRALAERRFGREALFREPLPPADAPLADQRLPADSYETIARFVAPMLRGLVLEQLAALKSAPPSFAADSGTRP